MSERPFDSRGGCYPDRRTAGRYVSGCWAIILSPMITIADITAARDRIAPHVRRTPLMTATRLGDAADIALSLKCESFQKTGSFKVRGALNAILRLDKS